MKNIITEELGYMKYLLGYKKGVVISEQPRTSFLSVFPTTNLLISKGNKGYNAIGGDNNTNIIYLTRRDETTGNEIPNSKFSYKVSGSYGFINFDIILRKVKRGRSMGNLTGEVLPKNSTVASIMKKLIPKDSLTKDGWLGIDIPVDKLNDALVKLHNNKGTSAEIKAGSGVNIKLMKI